MGKSKLPWLRNKKRVAFSRIQDSEEAKRVYDEVYNTARWKRLRATKLSAHPYCELCASVGDVEKAVYADHILPILAGGDAWSMENLQSLCKTCHAKKSARDARMRKKKR